MKDELAFLRWLSLLFIALQLTGQISWSWWLILAPVYVPAALAFTFGLITGYIKANNTRKARASSRT